MSLLIQVGSLTSGSAGIVGGWNAQCASYFAPSAIQRRNNACCSGVSVLFELAGGMRVAGSSEIIRSHNSLASTSPGTIAAWPPRSALADLGSSSLKSASLFVESGPWHLKQLGRQNWPDLLAVAVTVCRLPVHSKTQRAAKLCKHRQTIYGSAATPSFVLINNRSDAKRLVVNDAFARVFLG